jgi:hypothetical protein
MNLQEPAAFIALNKRRRPVDYGRPRRRAAPCRQPSRPAGVEGYVEGHARLRVPLRIAAQPPCSVSRRLSGGGM